MPVELKHGDIPPPPALDAPLWRYMSFAKLLALLTSGKLYFPKVTSLLGDDPFEGRLTSATLEMVRRIRDDPEVGEAYFRRNLPDRARRTWSEAWTIARPQDHFVSCWHLGTHESAALWKIYAGQHEGVAIRTTLAGLVRSIHFPQGPIFAGSVVYGETEADLLKLGNTLTPYFWKRSIFDYEREVRLLYWHAPDPKEDRAHMPWLGPMGAAFSCDARVLVDEVIISPHTPEWAAEAMSAVLAMLGLEGRSHRSTMLSLNS